MGYHHRRHFTDETGFEVNLLKILWLGIGRGRTNSRLILSSSQALKQPRDQKDPAAKALSSEGQGTSEQLMAAPQI